MPTKPSKRRRGAKPAGRDSGATHSVLQPPPSPPRSTGVLATIAAHPVIALLVAAVTIVGFVVAVPSLIVSNRASLSELLKPTLEEEASSLIARHLGLAPAAFRSLERVQLNDRGDAEALLAVYSTHGGDSLADVFLKSVTQTEFVNVLHLRFDVSAGGLVQQQGQWYAIIGGLVGSSGRVAATVHRVTSLGEVTEIHPMLNADDEGPWGELEFVNGHALVKSANGLFRLTVTGDQYGFERASDGVIDSTGNRRLVVTPSTVTLDDIDIDRGTDAIEIAHGDLLVVEAYTLELTIEGQSLVEVPNKYRVYSAARLGDTTLDFSFPITEPDLDDGTSRVVRRESQTITIRVR